MNALATPAPARVPCAPRANPTSECRFSVSVERHRDLVRATLVGFFSVQEVVRFAREEQAAVASLGCASGQHRVLIDATGCVLQAPEVVKAFTRVVTDSPHRARKIAVVAEGTLYRMQTRRILAEDRSAMFETMADAEAWIAADEASVAAARR